MSKKKKEDPSIEEPQKVEEIQEEQSDAESLKSMEAQIKDQQDKHLRLLAESENLRKRLQKEKADMQVYARESLICEFLNPIDQFAKALSFKDQQSDEIKNWMVGFEMILTQFKDVLVQNEIKEIESLGKVFDPHYHEAMETEETEDSKPNMVLQEYVKGYVMGSRVIRPAKVKVSKLKEVPSEESSTNKKNNQKEG